MAGFQCSIDGHAFSTCVSPVTLNDLTTGTHTFQVRAIDTSNNVDPMPVTFSWTVLTPTQGIQQLIHVIQTMGLSQGTQASLIAHLNAALAALASNNNPTACNVLGAFTNEVNAQIQSGHLTASQGSTNTISTSNRKSTRLLIDMDCYEMTETLVCLSLSGHCATVGGNIPGTTVIQPHEQQPQ